MSGPPRREPIGEHRTPPAGRMLWTFLFYTLAGPFLAGLLGAAVDATGLWTLPAADHAPLGHRAVALYIWAAIPFALTALLLLPFVWTRGTFGWVEAGMAGVIGFGIAMVLASFSFGERSAYAAFCAGLISVAIRHMLVTRGVLPP